MANRILASMFLVMMGLLLSSVAVAVAITRSKRQKETR
jgi:hypothetical protein